MSQWTSLVAQTVKRLPTMLEIQVQSLSWDDPLEKEMATHSSTLAWKIPWSRDPGRQQSMGVTKSQTPLSDFTSLHFLPAIPEALHQSFFIPYPLNV